MATAGVWRQEEGRDRFVRVQDQDSQEATQQAGPRRVAEDALLRDPGAPLLASLSVPVAVQQHAGPEHHPPQSVAVAVQQDTVPERHQESNAQPEEQSPALSAAVEILQGPDRSLPQLSSSSPAASPFAANPRMDKGNVDAGEVSKWSQYEVANFLREELPHAKEKINDIIVANEVYGLFFLKFKDTDWKNLGASAMLAKAFCHLASKALNATPENTHDRNFTTQPSTLGSRKVIAPSDLDLQTNVVDIEVKQYKHLSSDTIPSVEEIFINYGTDGIGSGAKSLRELGHTTQWHQLLQINRRIKKEIEENFPMFTKVFFRQKKGHWNVLRERIASCLVNGELEPLVFYDKNGAQHPRPCPKAYVTKRISNILIQRRSRLATARKTKVPYSRQYTEQTVDVLACQASLKLDDDTMEFLTQLFPKHYDDRLFPGGRGQVVGRRTTASGYSMLTLKMLSVVRADLVIPHSQIHLNEVEEGRQLEWLESLTTTDADPSVNELDIKEDDEEQRDSAELPERKKRKDEDRHHPDAQRESCMEQEIENIQQTEVCGPAMKRRLVQGKLPIVGKQDCETRMANLSKPIRMKTSNPFKVYPAFIPEALDSAKPHVGETVLLCDPSDVPIASGVVDAIGGSTHNIMLSNNQVRLRIIHIEDGHEDDPLPENATSDDDCKLLRDAFAYGNATPLRWPIRQLVFKDRLAKYPKTYEILYGEQLPEDKLVSEINEHSHEDKQHPENDQKENDQNHEDEQDCNPEDREDEQINHEDQHTEDREDREDEQINRIKQINPMRFDINHATMQELKRYCRNELGFSGKLLTHKYLKQRIVEDRKKGLLIPKGIENKASVISFREYIRFRISH